MKLWNSPLNPLYSGLVTSRHTIETEKLSGEVRIVLLADLHGTFYGENQAELLQRVAAEAPQLILLAGDMLDERRSFEPLAALLRGLTGLAPVYYTSGNHEYRIAHIESLFQRMSDMGVHLLFDECERLRINGQRLLLAGLRDPAYVKRTFAYSQPAVMRRAFSHLKADGLFKILLVHRPELFARYAGYPFDLIVSGHAHGGQVRIPFLDVGLYSHGVIFPKYTAGVHSLGGSRMAVSRGLSRFWFPPRVFNPPEIVSLVLKGKGPDGHEAGGN